MVITKQNFFKVDAIRKTKIETTYEYTPIIGEVLGYWRKIEQARIGETIELHISTPLDRYDRLFINGEQIDLKQP